MRAFLPVPIARMSRPYRGNVGGLASGGPADRWVREPSASRRACPEGPHPGGPLRSRLVRGSRSWPGTTPSTVRALRSMNDNVSISRQSLTAAGSRLRRSASRLARTSRARDRHNAGNLPFALVSVRNWPSALLWPRLVRTHGWQLAGHPAGASGLRNCPLRHKLVSASCAAISEIVTITGS